MAAPRSSAASLVNRVVLVRVPGIHVVNLVPRHARDRMTAGERLRQLDLERVDAGDVMHDHADLAAVLRQTGVPLRVRKGVREGRAEFFHSEPRK